MAFWEKSPEVMQISPDVVEERLESCGVVQRLLEEAEEKWEERGRREQEERFEIWGGGGGGGGGYRY